MWFPSFVPSLRRHKRTKKPIVAKQRTLRFEALEDRRLLAITIKGTIAVSNLPCATSGKDVPVAGALVTASYTVGGQTETKKDYTKTDGTYTITLNSAAVANTEVIMTVTAECKPLTDGKPAYVEPAGSHLKFQLSTKVEI